MADLTLPLIALTSFLGYYFSDNSKQRVEKYDSSVTKNELPTGQTIYTSNRVYDAEEQVYDKMKQNYIDSMDPENTNIIPPIYNTYGTRATQNLDVLGINDNKSIAQYNEFQRLANVKHTQAKPEENIVSAPMFKPFLEHQGELRESKEYTSLENLGGQEVSLLTDRPIDKRHNNMVPFFGGTIKQNSEKFTNTTRLDLYTGEKDTYIKKREIKSLQDKLPENIYGGATFTTLVEKDRYVPSYYRNNEYPVEREYVSAPIAGTGDNKIRPVFRTTDEIRAKNNPKLVYKARQNAGQIASIRASTVPVEKRRPERVWDWGEERWNKTTGEYTGPKMDENYSNLQYTNRPDTSIEYYGTVNNLNNVTESYIPFETNEGESNGKLTTMQQYAKRNQHIPGDNAYRNIDGSTSINYTNDYGKSGYNSSTVPETQRDTTYTTHILNANQQGNVPTTRFPDVAKTTIKDSVSNQPYAIQGQVSSDFNGGQSSAVGVGAAAYQVRSNQKESTVKNKYSQGARHYDYGMGYVTTNYTVDATNKEMTTNDPRSDYTGIANNKDRNAFESRLASKNVQLDNKQQELISNERIRGPQKFQIQLGKGGFGDVKHNDNKVFSEKENTVKLNVDSLKTGPIQEFIGEFDSNTSAKRQTVEQSYHRLDAKIYNQLDENPFVNNNLRAYKVPNEDYEGVKVNRRNRVMNTWNPM